MRWCSVPLMSLTLLGLSFGSDVVTSFEVSIDDGCKDLTAQVQCQEWAWFGEWWEYWYEHFVMNIFLDGSLSHPGVLTTISAWSDTWCNDDHCTLRHLVPLVSTLPPSRKSEKNKSYMEVNCRKACGLCPPSTALTADRPVCSNTFQKCDGWAADGRWWVLQTCNHTIRYRWRMTCLRLSAMLRNARQRHLFSYAVSFLKFSSTLTNTKIQPWHMDITPCWSVGD